ncbi:hypothetical protein AF331_17945 [Rossellomorea marisflavi]|uniref:DUF4760 domain-containing protein n=1 Tax=Rossellomorea marisflavi TaxID=189381 RepID=A0A0M0G190_9BACI|nr:hypothetical protein [Rossellomorea marisflavi]KON83377.1 hypothetical protein AF331_17945 [Rossellomorea marisflavi]
MTWIDYTTLGVSVGTLLLLVYNSIISNKAKKKDRRISVVLEERRKMHNELFLHITSVLDIGRKSIEIIEMEQRQEMKWKLLNHKIFIWLNLNKENKFSEQLRSHCNEYVFWCASILEKEYDIQVDSYTWVADKNVQNIWVLIDKYIKNENELKKKLI